MDKNENGNAENPKGVYIYDRSYSIWLNQPQSGTLPYRHGGEKASDFHRDAMGKISVLQQPQKFVNYDEPEGGIEPRPIPPMHDSDTNRSSTCRQLYSDRIDSQKLEVAFNHRNLRRVTPFTKQRQEPFDGDEKGCQKYPYTPSPSSQIRNHCKKYSRQHSSGQLGNYTPKLSTVPNQSCATTLPFIAPQNTVKEKSDPRELYRYSYQQKRLSTSIERNGHDSSTRYDRVWNPKRRYETLMPPNWSSRNSPDHSVDELCSTKIWPTMCHINQRSRPRTNQAARPLNVARRAEHSPGQKESDLVAYNVRKAESSGKERITTIASQSQMGCCLPPIEVAMDSAVDYSYRTRPEVMLLTGSKKSSNKREPSPIQEEMVKAAEFTNLAQARPRQSKLHKPSGGQKGGNGGRKKVSYQSTLILKEPVAALTEHHKE